MKLVLVKLVLVKLVLVKLVMCLATLVLVKLVKGHVSASTHEPLALPPKACTKARRRRRKRRRKEEEEEEKQVAYKVLPYFQCAQYLPARQCGRHHLRTPGNNTPCFEEAHLPFT